MDPTRGLIITRAEAQLATELMEAMTRSSAGWFNVMPEIPDDTRVPATPGVLAVFSKRGPAVPLGTWTPPTSTGRRPEPAQVGIQHGIGSAARPTLDATTGGVPADWVVLGDHPRRGFVAAVPPGYEHHRVLDWMLVALDMLCRVPSTGRFLVYVYEPDAR